MPYALGVDIGTSTLTTATYRVDDRDDPVVTTIHLGADGPSSTAVFITDDGRVAIGADAAIEATSRPERVLRGWGRRVGDTVPIAIGGALIAPEAIFAAVARWAVLEATELEGSAPAAVCVSHPAGWGEHRRSLLRGALESAGVADVVIVDEVEAAIEQHRVASEREKAIGVYDLGADRLTFSLMAHEDDRGWMRVASETIDGVGGSRLDDAVLAHVVASSTDAFSRFDTAAPGSMNDMRTLREECTIAKASLSSHDEIAVPVRLDEVASTVRIELLDLRSAIEQTVLSTAHVVREAHRRAERSEEETAIILVGGTCASPQLRTRLAAELDARVIVDDDPQSTIASGAARIAATHVDWSAPVVDSVIPASGSRSPFAAVNRLYAATVASIASIVQAPAAWRRRSAPAQDQVPPLADPSENTGTTSSAVAESEFDRIISPVRDDEAEDGHDLTRDRASERTEATR